MEQDTSVVKVPTSEEAHSPFDLSIAAIADTNLVAIAEQSEKRLAAFETIWRGSLSRTNAHDWVNEGGKPYLQASGAQKIARWLGVSWRANPSTEEDLGGGHYLIRYTGEFALGGAIITETGSRSSRDPFFRKSKGQELPASEIDKGNVAKAAYTNLLGRGIASLLGLRNLTWEDLKKYANIDQTKVAGVGYGKPLTEPGKAPSSQPEKESRKPTTDEPATEAQGKAIHAQLNKIGVADELTKMQKVAGILGLSEAPTVVTKLTKKQASTVIETLQKEIDGGEK